MPTNVQQVLDQVALIHLDVSLWEGRKKLRSEDLKGAAGELPPADVASLGSKKIIDPKEVAPFGRIKKRAERELAAIGTRLIGGYAIPLDRLDEATRALEELHTEFYQEKASFLDRYQERVDAWVASHAEWAPIIRRAVPDPSEPRSRLGFGWTTVQLKPVGDDPDRSAGLGDQVAALGKGVLGDVAEEAARTWRDSFQGRPEVGQRAVRPVRRLAEKLQAWVFVDPKVYELAGQAEAVLEALPKSGPIQGKDLSALQGLVLLLSDPDRTAAQIQGTPATAQEDEEVSEEEAPVTTEAESSEAESSEAVEEEAEEAPEPEPATAGGGGWFF